MLKERQSRGKRKGRGKNEWRRKEKQTKGGDMQRKGKGGEGLRGIWLLFQQMGVAMYR